MCEFSREQSLVLLHGKSHWATVDGTHQLYWSTTHGGVWLVDTDTDDSRYNAGLQSTADAPPSGPWFEYCNGKWGTSALTLSRAWSTSPSGRGCAVSARRLVLAARLLVCRAACRAVG